ncbi:MAG: excisionase [Lachnospiraceae bacterium]|nr:excisionase [Lachnospiraceae bacterium]
MTDDVNQYTLMHKNIPVVELALDTISGAIVSVGAVHEAAHVPVGILVRKGTVDRSGLNEWWKGRAIPASRSGIREALLELKVPDTRLLMQKCLGLSLSDQYWIRPTDSNLLWEKVNFFYHPFSEDVGNILFGKGSDSREISLMSPDNTSDGWLKKKWKIIDGKRCLIKGGSGATQQEPYNEVLASRIMDRLHIPHVSYSLITEGDYPYSVCEDFITPDTELVSAWYMMQTVKKPNHISVYRHYWDCCKRLGIGDIEDAMNRMLVVDYLIANEDRHLNNFGVVRRTDTLEYLGAAPIYDSGTSLWFDKPTRMINAKTKITCKPFKNKHEEQIKLVTDFSWLDFSALQDIDEEFMEIVKDSLFVDEVRREALCRGLMHRKEMLQEAALQSVRQGFVDNTEYDVTQNTAYSGYSKE